MLGAESVLFGAIFANFKVNDDCVFWDGLVAEVKGIRFLLFGDWLCWFRRIRVLFLRFRLVGIFLLFWLATRLSLITRWLHF